MVFGWRHVGYVLAGLAAVLLICAIDLRCSGDPAVGSAAAHVREELQEGRRERSAQDIESLSVLARDLRVMAKRYVEQGETRKAHRAIGAAQELDKRIQALMKKDR